MPIRIDISLSAGGRFKPVSSRTFNEAVVTVGRDEDCTLTLEDAHKHVSRVHAELAEEDGVYWMKVVSKVNPVIVNGKRLMSGNRVALADGDTLAIGLYRLEVHAVGNPEPAAGNEDEMTFVAGRSPFAAPPPSAAVAPPPAPAAPVEAEEATFVPPPKAPPAPPAKVAPPAEEEATYVPKPAVDATNPSGPAPAPEALDLDFDLSEETPPSEEATFVRPAEAAPPPKPEAPAVRTPSAAFMAQAGDEDENADEMTMIRRPGTPAPTAPVAAAPAPAAPTPAPRLPPASFMGQGEGDGADEMTMIGRPVPPAAKPAAPPPAPAPEAPPVRMPSAAFMDETEVENADEMTMIRRPSAAPAPAPKAADVDLSEEMTQYRPVAPAPAPAARPAGSGGDAAVRAFLEGAGLAHLDIQDPEAFMRDSGAMVRAAVEGVMMLLIARGEAQRELGAEAPDAGTADNPLKSMTDPAEVISFLFDPKRPAIGNVDPIQAFGEACGDLRAHQVALVASIRAAAMVALASFDPARIERDHGTNLGGLNLTRKSKLWDIAVAQHGKLSQDVVADFGSVFGREVLAAYNAQVKKVRGR